jgi:hypothetical protein
MMFVRVATPEAIVLCVANVTARLWVMIGMMVVICATIVTIEPHVGKLNLSLLMVKSLNSKVPVGLALN